FFGSSQWSKVDEPFFTPKNPGFTNGNQWTNQIGVKRLLPTGGTMSAIANLNYRDIDPAGLQGNGHGSVADSLAGIRTTYVSNFGLEISQPLLRSFGSDVVNANIYLAQRDYRESLAQFKLDVLKAVSDAEEAYHNLALS